MYTDGVTEATNTVGVEFGTERLIEIVKSNQNASSKELVEMIFEDINQFTDGYPATDDRTLFIVKKTG